MKRSISLNRRKLLGLAAGATAGLASPPLLAQGAPVVWKIVANTRHSRQFTVKWAWFADEIAKKTNGRLKLDVVSFPELGMTGAELIRVLNAGVLDGGEVVTGYVSGEIPLIEGAQMVGVYQNLDEARKAYAAWTTAVAEPNANRIGGVPIASFGFTSQYVWSKAPINSLDDLKGKKIRIFAKAQSDFLNALGASTVSIPIPDVYSALERGVIDAAVTGPEVANGAKYNEVAGHVTDLMLGPGAGFAVISQKAWRAMPADVKKEVESLLPELRKISWDLTPVETKETLDAIVGRGVKSAVPVKPEWVPQLKKVAQDVVVPEWVKRAGGANAAKIFNENIAPIVGFEAKA